jgi:hypothetical protein
MKEKTQQEKHEKKQQIKNNKKKIIFKNVKKNYSYPTFHPGL